MRATVKHPELYEDVGIKPPKVCITGMRLGSRVAAGQVPTTCPGS